MVIVIIIIIIDIFMLSSRYGLGFMCLRVIAETKVFTVLAF
jgi:hypothetical protein